MGWKVMNILLPLLVLCLWRLQEGADACKCLVRHPQEVFCQADVVIKAKVLGGKTDSDKLIKYIIKQTKMFKGPKRNFDAVYTASSSVACGVTLKKGTMYLLMGKLESKGLLRITGCDFFQPWSSVSAGQKRLLRRYEKGCDCKIVRCTSIPCGISNPAECLWTQFLPIKMASNEQAQNFACLKKGYGYCAWTKASGSP
ncbi:metalloproteinase inhibitor 2-like [Hippocampus zosterae]|uniref:metalloproteinase inhibitor 2-like n=1 Tax=Hippocampus zosterae TaxID=109293 RepID=UPI00223E3669|nr:metalloproteinase inhibitor 2-like [Hippocampus zosterae]